MNNSLKTALCAMAVALGTIFMLFGSMIPALEYAVPALTGILVLFIQSELNKGWALGVYASTSLLGVFVVPNKEAVGMYIALLGIYPILKKYFDKLPKIIAYILKSLFFVVDVVAVYYIMINLLFINSAQELMEDMTKFTLPILLVCGLAAFIVYDIALAVFEKRYSDRFHKIIMKLYRKK